MTDQSKTDGLEVDLGMGQPGPNTGPSVDFMAAVVNLLCDQYGNRKLTQDAWNSWIAPLGKIERDYRGLAEATKQPAAGKGG